MDENLLKRIEWSVFEYANEFVEDFDVPILFSEKQPQSGRTVALSDPPSLAFLSDHIEEASASVRDCDDALDYLLSEIESEVRSISESSSISLSGWKSELKDILEEASDERNCEAADS